jgi:hypothetical protein
MHCHTDLLEVINALRAPGRFSRALNSGEQQSDEKTNDADNHEQLD